MLSKIEFRRRFVKCCREGLLDRGVEGMEIIQRKVNKAQHGVLNGLIFKPKDCLCAPTFYVEQFYPLYLEGRSIVSLSRDAVEAVVNSLDMARAIGASKAYDFSNAPEKLSVRMLNISRNREYLKDVMHLDLGCGFALVTEVSSGEYRAVMTNELFEDFGMSKEELFEKALKNSSENDPAVLWSLTDAACAGTEQCANLLEMPAESNAATHCSSDIKASMYVLSNQRTFWGAAALFYPGIIDKLHQILDGDFYILPSSVHELIILPVHSADPEMLRAMIRDANETIVDCEDILSDDLYICSAGTVSKAVF